MMAACNDEHDELSISMRTSNSASSEYEFVTKRTFELLGKEDKSVRCKTAGFDHMERLHELSESFLDCTAASVGAIQKFITKPKKTVVEWKFGTSDKNQEVTTTLRKKKKKQGLRKEIPGRENEAVRCQRLQQEGRNDRTVLKNVDGLGAEERGIIEESIKYSSAPQQDDRNAPPPDEPEKEFATPIGNGLFMIPVYSQSSRSVYSPKKKEKPSISKSLFTLSASLRSATSRESKKGMPRTGLLEESSPEFDVAPIPKLITTISSHASSLNEHTSHGNTSFGYTTNEESAMGFPMTSSATPAPMANELTSHGETSPGYTSGYTTGYTTNGESTLGYTANGQPVYYRPPATGFQVNEVSLSDDDLGFTTSNEGTSTGYTTQGYSTCASKDIAPLARLRPRFRPQASFTQTSR